METLVVRLEAAIEYHMTFSDRPGVPQRQGQWRIIEDSEGRQLVMTPFGYEPAEWWTGDVTRRT